MVASRRPRHPVGWLLLALGLSLAASGVFAGYAPYGLTIRPGAVPAAGYAALFYPTTVFAALASIGFILLLTPTGSLPSPRWRWLATTGGTAVVLLVLAMPFLTESLVTPYPYVDNPLDLRAFDGALLFVNQAALVITLVLVLAGAGALVSRFVHARGVERQQLRWVALAAGLTAMTVVAMTALAATGQETLVGWAASAGVMILPPAIGAAILRYRLYDVDRIVSRVVAYGLLTVVLGLTYVAVVLLLGQLLGRASNLTVAVATLAVAGLFRPARQRVQQVVDRRFNRRRYDASTTIQTFAAGLRREVDLAVVAAGLSDVINQTMQPTTASLWLRGAPNEPVISR